MRQASIALMQLVSHGPVAGPPVRIRARPPPGSSCGPRYAHERHGWFRDGRRAALHLYSARLHFYSSREAPKVQSRAVARRARCELARRFARGRQLGHRGGHQSATVSGTASNGSIRTVSSLYVPMTLQRAPSSRYAVSTVRAPCLLARSSYHCRMSSSAWRIPVILLALLAANACIASDDLALSEQGQAEIIQVSACQPGYLEIGEGHDMVCIDPWPGGGWGGGGGGGGERGPDGPRGGGGGEGGGPGPKPDRKQCGPEMGLDKCLDCCLYNNMYVDGWECNRKRSKKAQAECWVRANEELSRCQVETCGRDRPIITTGVPQ